MTIINKQIIAVAICLLCASCFTIMLVSQTTPRSSVVSQSSSVRAVFSIDQKNDHLGGGVSISPDGHLLVFVGEDNRLHLRHVDTDEERVLLEEVGAGLDVFSNPEFSSDGKRVLFSASGGTRYYPSNIYSITLDGSGLQQLTQAKQLPETSTLMYAEYFYWAKESPDGSRILLRIYDPVAEKERVGIMNSSNKQVQYLVDGRPISWSNDNQSIFYYQDGLVKRFNLNTKESQILDNLSGQVLGISNEEAFVVEQDGISKLASIQDHAIATHPLGIPSALSVSHIGQKTGKPQTDHLVLTAIEGSMSLRFLLYYQGETMERIEVVETPGS